MTALLILSAVLGLAMVTVVLVGRFSKNKATTTWLKNFVIPVFTPLAVGTFGALLALQGQERAEAERQQSAMREIMVSGDRQVTSSLLSVDREITPSSKAISELSQGEQRYEI